MHHWTSGLVGLIASAAALWPAAVAAAAPIPAIDFQRDIQPLLVNHCIECHGQDKPKAGLNLGSRDGAMAKLKSGHAAITPGKMGESELIRRVTHVDPEERMPRDKPPLSPRQVDLLKRWIEQGAEWAAHWAYQPVAPVAPPRVKNSNWVRNDIDRFVLAGLERRGIAPSPEADRATLIRRVYYDLLGLPPAPAEVDAFMRDASEGAYERLVERVLSSPRFGERWGRHWLDKARYADSDGYEKDRPRPDAWRYRDWVIAAFNADMPFDQFTIKQLAGDLLPGANESQKLATAFHRQTLTNEEGGVDKEQFRVEAVFDRTETTGAVWLGLTVGCARCHNHKYDQISQREYYQLFAFFNNADEALTKVPTSAEAWEEYESKNAAHQVKVAAAEAKFEAAKSKLAARLPELERELTQRLAAIGDKPVRFEPLEIVSVTSKGGVKFKKMDDGSYLARGKQAANDSYTIVAKHIPGELTGIRLEALPDETLPGKGPGRSSGGNFVLSEVTLHAGADEDQKSARRIELHSPTADFSQDAWPVAAAIDGIAETGWAISPQMGQPHHAVFRTISPVASDSATHLFITLDQNYKNGDHSLGRFRLLAMTGTNADTIAPPEVRAALEVAAEQRNSEQGRVLLDHFAKLDEATAKLAAGLDTIKQRGPKPPLMDVRVLEERQELRPTHLLHRGDFLSPADEVASGGLDVLPPLKPRSGERPDRLDLAQWLIDERNPLTPRVAVNHIWAHLFGQGLVPTVDDFGVRGETPTHPELLDWLAVEFMRSGWSRKHMIRLIMTSATYRQSSAHRPDLMEIDAANHLLARQNRVRVEGEVVRDLHLAASGLLSETIGGPSVYPPMPPDVAALSYANNFKWTESKGDDRYRRGMYTFFKRTAPHPDLMTFDCPDANVAVVDRNTSNTPLQALTTLNADAFAEAARAMGKRLLTESHADDGARIERCFRLCVSRKPTTEERSTLLRLLADARGYYRDHADDAKQLVGSLAAEGVIIEEFAAWIAAARIIMNMDEFIVRE